MLDWSELDRMSVDMARRVELAYTEISHTLWQQTKGMTAQETAVFMNTISIESLMAAKLVNVFADYEAGIISVLENTVLSGSISGEFLTAQLNQSISYLSTEFVTNTSAAMRSEIFKGIANGLDIDDVVQRMRELGFDERHLQTIVKSGFAQYDNAITNAMGSESEENSMWVYIGAYDGKTRPACEQKILSSPAKKSDIIARFGNLDNEVWNCRHKWEPVTTDIVGQGYEEKKL